MISGKITARREARLRLTILAPDQQELQVDVVIDTGLNGFLTLPDNVIRALRLRSIGARSVTLGDGSTIVLTLYQARVAWHEHERRVLILQAASDPLVGMALLYGSRVVLNVEDDGDVLIEPLR